MPTQFTGTLNPNEIFGAIYNMIISQEIYTNNLSGLDDSLVNKFRVDGSMYGDTKLYYASDILVTHPWLGDLEASNLLALDRPAPPKCQKIVLDQFRQIRLTTDNYLSKRAWATEFAFAEFNAFITAQIGKTKKLYDAMLINSYVGTTEGASNRHLIEIPLSDITETGEAKNRLRAQMIAKSLADLMDDLKDASRDFNDYKFMDSFNVGELMIIWNNKFVNEITLMDIPSIYHNEKLKAGEEILNSRFFGEVNAVGGTTGSNNTTVRSLIETDYGTSPKIHVYPGDLLPNSTAYEANTTYTVDDDVICKVIHKDSIKFMSGFQTDTEFFNPRSLTQNHYLTFGYSEPDYLMHLPYLTVHAD